MLQSPLLAPLQIETVLARYDPMIRTCIQRVKRGTKLCPEDLEDLRSMVIARMVERGDLAKYDPAKSSLSTYLWYIVYSTAATEFGRAAKRPTDPTRVRHLSDQGVCAVGDQRLHFDRAAASFTPKPLIDAGQEMRLIWADLTARFRARLGELDSQLLTCWGYLAESRQKSEIASLMGLGLPEVDRLTRRIRREARAWRDELSTT